ncbi:hypothetical protein LXL04_002772 [Taraxacum kok-saghyz]
MESEFHIACEEHEWKPFRFTFAYHSHLSVSDIRYKINDSIPLLSIEFDFMIDLLFDSEARVEGLETMDYFDNLCEREKNMPLPLNPSILLLDSVVKKIYQLFHESDTLAIKPPKKVSNGEIFGPKRRNNVSSIIQIGDRVYNLDWFTNSSKNEYSAAIGFKWMLNQVNLYYL